MATPSPPEVTTIGALLALLLLPAPAWAGPAQDAALLAAEVQEEHCFRLLREDAHMEADALGAVAGALQAVGAAHAASPEPYLLYWRGALAQCIGYDDSARADLLAFWNATGGDGGLAGQREDAARRLRHLGVVVEAAAAPTRAGLAVGIGLLAGGGAAAGLAGWQHATLRASEEAYVAGDHRADELAVLREQGESAALGTDVLGSVAVGMAVAAVPLFVLDTVLSRGIAPRASAQASPTVLPTRHGGIALGVIGRW